MRLRTALPLVVFVMALGVGLAQGRPDFSGSWALQPAADSPVGTEPRQLVITQSPTEMTVVRTTTRGTNEVTYRLDGVETVESNMLGDTKVVAAWDGGTLVVTRTRTLTAPSGPVADIATETYTMDGATLVVSSNRKLPSGDERTERWRYARQ